jgi:hypothetical protein
MRGIDLFTWIFLGLFMLAVVALRSVWKSAPHARKVKIIWSAVVLIPLVGPVAWFVLGRDRRRRR